MSESRRKAFVLETFAPAYARTEVAADLRQRAARALSSLESCRACPRECGADRLAGGVGVCETGRHARVSSAFPHTGEERCLVGTYGSGTIFFSWCNLKCVFCQNADISQQPAGELLDAAVIADRMLRLQAAGCHNINFVSPSHVVAQIIEAVAEAVPRGLNLPLVYNTNAYDSVATLGRLDGIVDIYMPDFKFWAPRSAARYCRAEDYPERARAAVKEMHRQVGDLSFDSTGVAKRGLLVRHLVMPGGQAESAAIFRWLAEEISPDTFVNVMAQYRPAHRVGRSRLMDGALSGNAGASESYTEINRPLRQGELEQAYDDARRAGLWRFDA
ncbi:MAG: hypothetical protein JSV19_11095 [Phycisphaerales bacterium]|nr:MAG: hypothetical protein JSV19_11095 [Phycisphaerales bacterium]